jgi:DNA-binding IclR family transcriptional regulator
MLGKAYERSNTLITLARPVLREAALEAGESAKLFVVEGDRRLCLVREEGPYPLRYAVNEGEMFEMFAGASGKVLLAFSDETFRERILASPLQKITPSTLVDREQLDAEFRAIRAQGYGVSRGEIVPEVAGIAAPVFDHTGSIRAALALAGPIQRFTDERFPRIVKTLLAASKTLSRLLGHEG